jgi:hypothetical protein
LIRIGAAALDRMVLSKMKRPPTAASIILFRKINQQGAHQQRKRPQTLV